MNYWHLQLHQGRNNRLSLAQFEQILSYKQVIGLGYPWKNQKGKTVPDSNRFQKEMVIGDIVMIRDGKTPIALVKVISDAYEEIPSSESIDWFPIRRKIEVLEYFKDRPELKGLLEDILKEKGNKYIQVLGTLNKANDDSKATAMFIKEWWELLSSKLGM